MSNKDEQAFPGNRVKPMPGGGTYTDQIGGLTKREYAAIHAPIDAIAKLMDGLPERYPYLEQQKIARYRWADAMLEKEPT